MKLGEVVKFTSDQAVGYDLRRKLHVFVTITDNFRAPEENAFLFISSGDYGGCFPIQAAEYPKMLDRDSYISCGNLVFYSKKFLTDAKPTACGDISRDHLKALHGHLVDSQNMPGWQIKIACSALASLL